MTDQLNIDIRNKVISREDALQIAIQKDGQVDEKTIEEFCNYIEFSRSTYDEIMDSFVNHDIFHKDSMEIGL